MEEEELLRTLGKEDNMSFVHLCAQTRHLVCKSVAVRLDVGERMVEDIYRRLFEEVIVQLSQGNEVILDPLGRLVYDKSRRQEETKTYEIKHLVFERTPELTELLRKMTRDLVGGRL